MMNNWLDELRPARSSRLSLLITQPVTAQHLLYRSLDDIGQFHLYLSAGIDSAKDSFIDYHFTGFERVRVVSD